MQLLHIIHLNIPVSVTLVHHFYFYFFVHWPSTPKLAFTLLTYNIYISILLAFCYYTKHPSRLLKVCWSFLRFGPSWRTYIVPTRLRVFCGGESLKKQNFSLRHYKYCFGFAYSLVSKIFDKFVCVKIKNILLFHSNGR